MSLAGAEVHAALPVQDLERARKFYEQKLGLKPGVETPGVETPGGILYQAGGDTRVLVFISQGSSSGSHTQAGWDVDDIGATVAELRARGVVFEEYDFPSLKTVDSIADVPAGRAAWFKDPDGNLHGLIQFSS